MFIRLILFVFCLNLSFAIQGQVFNIQHYHERNGLETPLVKSITKDTLGVVWLTSDDGLVRFDGTNFTVYGENHLPSKFVKHIFCRKNGELWVTSDGGVIRINPEPQNISFEIVLKNSITKNDSLPFYPKNMYEDKKEVLWFSDNHKVFRFQDGKFKTFLNQEKNLTDHFHRSFSFFEDKYDNFYAFSQTGFLFLYDRKKETFTEIKVPEAIGHIFHVMPVQTGQILIGSYTGLFAVELDKKGNFINTQLIDSESNISWITIYNQQIYASSWTKGILRIEPKNNTFKTIPVMKDDVIASSYIYASGRELWITTDNGLFLLIPKTFLSVFEEQIGKKYIQCAVEDTEKNILISNGNEVFEHQKGTKTVRKIYENNEEQILTISPFKDELRMGSTSGNLIYKKGNQLKINNLTQYGGAVYSIFSAKDGSVWVCQDKSSKAVRVMPDQSIKVYDDSLGLSSRPVVFRQNLEGKIYVGGIGETEKDFLFEYDEINDAFKRVDLPMDFKPVQRLVVNDIRFNSKNEIYIGTSEGLVVQKEGKFHRLQIGKITTEAVKALTFTKTDELWIASGKGVIKYDKAMPFAFSEFEGLPSKILSYRGLLVDSGNKLWAVTASGMAYAETKTTIYETPTPVIIKMQNAEGKNLNTFKKHQISEEDFLNISFICPIFPSGGTQFKMLLLSKNDTIHKNIEGNIPLLLSNLKSGDYHLEVRAKKRGNFQRSKPIILDFTVYKLWYKTLWGNVLILILLVATVGGLMWMNTQRLKQQQIKLEQVINERTKEIQGQKNQIKTLLEDSQQTNEELQQQTEELTIINEKLEEEKDKVQEMYTELQSTQSQLVQSEKMASLGQLVAGIAHEINNPVNFIYAGSDSLRTLLEEFIELIEKYDEINEIELEKIPEFLQEIAEWKEDMELEDTQNDMFGLLTDIRTGAERTAEIVKGLRTFSRLDEDTFKRTDVHENLDSTLIILRTQYKDRIEVERQYDKKLTEIECYPGKLNQVFMNILANAIQAITGEGKITIKTTLITDNQCQIKIQDTGKGMPESVISKIFDPFFTTKDVGEGTGLGLSISLGIIEKHQGILEVESQENQGTTFIMTLPLEQIVGEIK